MKLYRVLQVPTQTGMSARAFAAAIVPTRTASLRWFQPKHDQRKRCGAAEESSDKGSTRCSATQSHLTKGACSCAPPRAYASSSTFASAAASHADSERM